MLHRLRFSSQSRPLFSTFVMAALFWEEAGSTSHAASGFSFDFSWSSLAIIIFFCTCIVLVGLARSKTQRRVQDIYEHAVEGIFQTTLEGRFISANRAMATILGYDSPGELVREITDIGHQLYAHPHDREKLLRLLREDGSVQGLEAAQLRKDGLLVWVQINARIVNDRSGHPLRIEGFVTDITQRKLTEAQLRKQRLYDPLTELANRDLLTDRISRAIERTRRREDYYFSVLFVDIDRLKVLNDSYGHAFGDAVLKTSAQRLRNCVRELDTVARFGSDEFVVLLEEIDTPREAARILKRIHTEMRASMTVDDQAVQITVSSGVVLNTAPYTNAEDLLRNADIAMHRAKDQGPDRFKVFTPRLHEEAVWMMSLETDMDRALAEGEFYVVFQPIVGLEADTLMGFEALARWRHPERGEILPSEFIPVAEETGRIDALGLWVLSESCSNMADWRAAHPEARPLILSVNISSRQFAKKDIVNDIRLVLEKTNFPADRLRLELTETAIMQDARTAVRRMKALRALGVTIAVDDFGTGYSSMSYLQQLPLDNLKIDLGFVQKLEQHPENREIVRAIISLAGGLGLNVVAEGVESAIQKQVLSELGCQMYQGYLFARPMKPEQAKALIMGNRETTDDD
ncbi:putative bifunctional diguanylate cyclase/phosphodiesterase [Desulfovibrio ferrophilus]|uniref:putative bifunctional diguanylate cyclase/phosphodiesterase n=1 Tax=Desulfovibrio ferrophilus TaxID=241368 RepID=UPI0015624E26|nr:bifunctional diguanylate cyclase/phosphodiesterase [Desulfovibrio ferrophilus]